MKTCLAAVLNLMLTLWMLLVGLLMVPFIFLAACWVQYRLRNVAQSEEDYEVSPVIIEAEKGRDYRHG